MSIKFIAFDLDGTLLDSNKDYSEEFIPFVKSHPEILFALSSGRQYYCLRKQFEEIADQLLFVAENGAVVFYKDEIIYKNIMSRKSVDESLKLARSLPGNAPIACGINSAYMGQVEDAIKKEPLKYYERFQFVDDLDECAHSDEVMKIAVFIRDKKAGAVYSTITDVPEGTAAVLSGDDWIDISGKDVDKGRAIKVVLEKFGIKREEAMAFGDYLNDMTMMEVCGESYAMKNALAEVKEIAKHITEFTNDENGVMETLKSLFG